MGTVLRYVAGHHDAACTQCRIGAERLQPLLPVGYGKNALALLQGWKTRGATGPLPAF